MLPGPAPEDLAAGLLETGFLALALVELPTDDLPSIASVIAGLGVAETSVELRGRVRVGEIPYGLLVFVSAPSAATTGIGADPKAVVLTCNDIGASRRPADHPCIKLLGVARILEFCHSLDAGLVHGNLNMDAISIVGSTVVVSGFEHCGMHPILPHPSSGGNSWSPPGNVASMAPELIERGTRTTQTDVYAFGVLIFRVYAGEYPFARLSTSSRYTHAAPVHFGSGKRPGREAIHHKHFTEELWALMNECWAPEPSARPTLASVRGRLAQMMV